MQINEQKGSHSLLKKGVRYMSEGQLDKVFNTIISKTKKKTVDQEELKKLNDIAKQYSTLGKDDKISVIEKLLDNAKNKNEKTYAKAEADAREKYEKVLTECMDVIEELCILTEGFGAKAKTVLTQIGAGLATIVFNILTALTIGWWFPFTVVAGIIAIFTGIISLFFPASAFEDNTISNRRQYGYR